MSTWITWVAMKSSKQEVQLMVRFCNKDFHGLIFSFRTIGIWTGVRKALSVPANRLFAVMLCFILFGTCQVADAGTVGDHYCDGPLHFGDCRITGRGELQCEAINQTAELIVPQPDNQFLAWAYDDTGANISSNNGNYAYPGQIVPFGTGTVTFTMAPGTTKVILCMTNPEKRSEDQILHQVTENATRSIDLFMVILHIPILLGGIMALYLTLYGVFTGRFPNFKRKKVIKRFLRIKRGRSIAESMAEDWVLRDETPVEFWFSVFAGLLTAGPVLAYAIPLLLEELW